MSNLRHMADQYTFLSPEYSEWSCHLFGGTPGQGLVWRPLKGHEPNRFWRWMQFLVLGNRWIKDSHDG